MERKETSVEPRAIVLNEVDTVAVMLEEVEKGTDVRLFGAVTGTVTTIEPIEFGHKVALTEHQKGNSVRKYGEVIGKAAMNIQKGSWVHIHNLESCVDQFLKQRIKVGGGKTG